MSSADHGSESAPHRLELRRQALQSIGFAGTTMVAVRAISFFQTVVLARLLRPADFGLVTMVDVIISLAGLPGGAGINMAVIQSRSLGREAFSTLYWLNLLFGLGAYALVVVAAPWIAAAYREPRLLDILAWAALPLVLTAFGAPFQSLAERDLDFRKLAGIELSAIVMGALVAIAAAFAGAGVYALIAGNVVTTLFRSTLLVMRGWSVFPLQARIRLAHVREHVSFGFNLAGIRLANYLGSNIDFMLIGRFVGAQSLGSYVLAYNLANIPSNYVNPVFLRVAYPVLAKLQDDPDRMKRAFLRVQEITSAINLPILFGMATVASIAIPAIYGQSWAASISLLEVLVILGIGRSVIGITGPLIVAKGRTDLGFRWSLMVLALQVPGLYLGVRFGSTAGVATAFSFLTIIYTVLVYPVLVRTLLGPCLKSYLGTFVAPLAASIAMVAAVAAMPLVIGVARPTASLALEVGVGAIVYVALFSYLRPDFVAELRRFVGDSRGEAQDN